MNKATNYIRVVCARVLLRILNTQFINQTPCRYEFVGNVDAFSRSHLESSERQQPGITVQQILRDADAFKCCPITPGVTVIQDGEYREAGVWDLHELHQSLTVREGTDSR